MTMKVSLVLDLVNRMSPKAKGAQKDLRGLKAEAERLKSTGGSDKLNRDLKLTSSQAQAAQAAIAKARSEVKALTSLTSPSRLNGDLNQTARSAQAAATALAKARTEAKALGNTSAKPKGLDDTRKALGSLSNRRNPANVPNRKTAAGVNANEAQGMSAGRGAVVGAAAAAGRGALMRASPVLAPAAIAATSLNTFKDLESAEKELAITTGESDAAIRQATEGFREAGKALGVVPQEMVKAAQSFAAAGGEFQDLKVATATVEPTIRTAKAAFAETNDVAAAGIAVMQNQKIKVSELQEAYDRMAVSAKEGRVEMKDLARELPGALASYALVGKQGLEGVSDITAQMQIMRTATSSAAEASNRLQNFYSKATAEETVKNFKEQRINLQKEVEAGAKQGVSTIDTVLKLTEKLVRKKDGSIDGFKLNALFGDLQAREYVQTMLKNMKELAELRTKISKTGTGTVSKDFARATDRLQIDIDKAATAWNTLTGRLGEKLTPAARSFVEILTKGLIDVDKKLEEITDPTRSGPIDRKEARERGKQRALEEIEGKPTTQEKPVENKGANPLANEFEGKVINPLNRVFHDLFGLGEAGNKETDIKYSEGAAYRTEVDRLQAKKLADAENALQLVRQERQRVEKNPLQRKESKVARLSELNTTEQKAAQDVSRVKEMIETTRKGRDDEIKAVTAEIRSLTSTLQNIHKMAPPKGEAKPFTAKPGAGKKTSAEEAIGGGGAPVASGKIGFGLGGPVAKDILQSLQVEMKPAGGLIVQQMADGMKGAQGQTDGAAQQIGDGIKTKVSSIDLTGPTHQFMAGWAGAITSGGAQVVAAAEGVAARVKKTLAGASAGGSTASVRNTLSRAQHDGVA